MAAQLAPYFLAFREARCGLVTPFPPMECEQSDVCKLYDKFFLKEITYPPFSLGLPSIPGGILVNQLDYADEVKVVGPGRAVS